MIIAVIMTSSTATATPRTISATDSLPAPPELLESVLLLSPSSAGTVGD